MNKFKESLKVKNEPSEETKDGVDVKDDRIGMSIKEKAKLIDLVMQNLDEEVWEK